MEGVGRNEERTWREPSVLAVGIYRENAMALGRLFGENAIVAGCIAACGMSYDIRHKRPQLKPFQSRARTG